MHGVEGLSIPGRGDPGPEARAELGLDWGSPHRASANIGRSQVPGWGPKKISRGVLLESRTHAGPGLSLGPCLDKTPSPSWSQEPKGDSGTFKEGTPKWAPRGRGPRQRSICLGPREVLSRKVMNETINLRFMKN